MTTPTPQSVDTLASGRTSTGPFITIIKDRAPTGNDGTAQGYQVGQRWVDTSTGNSEYFLLNFISSNGVVQANWVLLVSGTSTVETLTGNSGTAVTPDGFNNINVVGDGTTGLLFNGASHTLTGTLNDIPNSALANDDITLIAGTGISITVSPVALGGSTTISATAAVPTSFTEDTGVATPSLNNLNIFGAGGIATTGSGATVTIDGSGVTDTLTVDADSGSASPSSGVLNVIGAGGITTSGSGNTVTITGTSPGSISNFQAILVTTVNNVTGAGTGYHVIFDTSIFNVGSNYNSATGTFTATTAGKYFFSVNVLMNNVSNTMAESMIRFVSTSQNLNSKTDYSLPGPLLSLNNSALINMSIGDTCYVEVFLNGGAGNTAGVAGNISPNGFTYFSGFLVSTL